MVVLQGMMAQIALVTARLQLEVEYQVRYAVWNIYTSITGS